MARPFNARPTRSELALRRAVAEVLERRQLLSVSVNGEGWTVVTQSDPTDRVVYVSHTDGVDAAGRGFSESSPVRSLQYVLTQGLIRDRSGDHLLLKRGDVWTDQDLDGWTARGRSASEPILIGTYGTAAARPSIRSNNNESAFNTSGNGAQNLVIQGIQFYAHDRDPGRVATPTTTHAEGIRMVGNVHNVLIEDVEVAFYSTNITTGDYYGPNTDLRIRRSIVRNAYSTDSHANGIYISAVDGVLLEENVFDHNGWNPQVTNAGSTIYNHNAYVQSNSANLTAVRNVFARGSSHGLQARPGGVIEDNAFIDNPIGLSFGLVNGAPVKNGGVGGRILRNTFLGGGFIQENPSAGNRGTAMQLGNIAGPVRIADNVIAHYTGGAANEKKPAIEITIPSNPTGGYYGVGINDLTIENNRIYNWNQGLYINGSYDPNPPFEEAHRTLNNFVFRDNHVQQMASTRLIELGAFNAAEEAFSGNRYGSAAGAPVARVGGADQSLATWVANNEGPGSAVATESYTAPNRTAGSYAAAEFGAANSTAGFVGEALKQRQGDWDVDRTGKALSDYVRAGFFGVPPTVPLAPSGLSASAATSSQVNLTWVDNANNETGFEIDRATNSAFTAGLTTLTAAANATSFSDTGLAEWTTYYYRVRATNAAGDSPNSATDSAQTPGVPATPSGLAASAASSSQINLTWLDNSSAETGYEIDRATDSAFTVGLTTATVGANATSYSSTGLAAGTTYYYRVRGTNQWGDSLNSNTASATTQVVVVPPAAPTGLAASPASATQINLSWTDNANNETGFTIDRATDAAFTQGVTTVTAAANATSFNATGLTEWTTYYFRVRATNSGGASAHSNTASAQTPGRPVAPSNLVASSASATQVWLTWTDNSNWETGHRVERATNSTFTAGLTTFTTTTGAGNGTGTRSYTDTTAQPGTSYFYRVYAYNTHGDSAAPSNVAAVRSLAPTADAYVRNGTYAATNYGPSPTLDVKQSTTSGNTREAYLKFDLTSLSTISSAKLRLYGLLLNGTDSVSVSLYDVSNTTWTEGGLTWNNKPASATTALATATVTSTSGQWYEWNLTAWLQQQKAAGRTSVTLAMKTTAVTTAYASFNSGEATTNAPQLVVT